MVMRPRPATRRRPARATTAAAGLAVVLTGGLAACSSEGSARPAAAAGPSVPVSVPSYDPAKGARSDATAGTCGPDKDGGWSLAGTVRNTAKSKRSYSIVVDFVTDKGSTVVDTRVVKVPGVEPGTSVPFSVAGAAGRGRDALRCVLRDVQFG
ncbi:hypothetical protein [Pseudofrankia inefficax]|uniref:Secreted protein n=1 Tax=Pseudofrankia inefficax (strain DSM 45817 / CECT 9037 / DDB 130130 / EuI1c) TaxID=298654 RepID=E3J2F8_PSEI1|nr:hypothetical protein [Pseudofrankia inefficax]ADP79330.1 hypothetical protein FraEuI1c_1258 [Pseudofrankia inefficax]